MTVANTLANLNAPRAGHRCLARGFATALAALCLLVPQSAAADAPRLTALLKASRLVVRAQVTDVAEYDNDRIAVATLRVDEVLKGTPVTGNVSVIEMRDLPVPPLFETGRNLIAFLVPGTSNSYLAQHIPAGDYMSPVKVKPGCLVAESNSDAEAMARVIGRMVVGGQQPERDVSKRAVSSRKLGFDLVAASNAVLVDDGVTTIGGLENLAATLTSEEQHILESALTRSNLPARVRIALIQTIAKLNLKQLVPALQRIDTGELADSAWEALSRLGAAPAREEMEKHLANSDPAVRTAAIRQLLRHDKAAAVPRAAQLAKTDPDTTVRVAAIEALGKADVPEAVPALEIIFAEPTWETRQAVGRALIQVGGRTAAEAFERMAFTGPPDAQRYAVVLLLLSVPRDDTLVQRVQTTHPDPEIRSLAEHGVEAHHH